MTEIEKTPDLVDQLAQFEVFANVERSALEWLVAKSTYHFTPAGEFLFHSGEVVNHMSVILSGEYVVRVERQGRRRELGVWGAGNIMGVLPFSRMVKVGADGVALEDAKFLMLHKNCFVEMVNVSYDLTQALVAVMTSRVRDFQQSQLMDEKLMALGKMSAGLAHELNNPASAMVRASNELYKQIHLTPDRFKSVIQMDVDPETVDIVNEVLFTVLENYGQQDLSLLESEELKDDITDWLEDVGCHDCEELADTFTDFNFGVEQLDQVQEALPESALESVLWWIETNLSTERLVQEIQTASERIGSLVKSIKTYSHMDEDPSMELIDIHQGLKSTLMMLMFRFKKGNIGLEKSLDYSLPKVKAFSGELNQVWTNLIVNALDAMPASDALLKIKSYQERDCVCIEIQDNGAGIPPDIQSRIFEPFFTTKAIGEGTGMGLDIVNRVIRKHNGYINVTSEPGQTTFKVCFPIHQDNS